jgi:hypothetical protein
MMRGERAGKHRMHFPERARRIDRAHGGAPRTLAACSRKGRPSSNGAASSRSKTFILICLARETPPGFGVPARTGPYLGNALTMASNSWRGMRKNPRPPAKT